MIMITYRYSFHFVFSVVLHLNNKKPCICVAPTCSMKMIQAIVNCNPLQVNLYTTSQDDDDDYDNVHQRDTLYTCTFLIRQAENISIKMMMMMINAS